MAFEKRQVQLPIKAKCRFKAETEYPATIYKHTVVSNHSHQLGMPNWPAATKNVSPSTIISTTGEIS